MLHMARYENGAEEGVMLAFRQLGGYGDTLAGLNQLDDQTLWKLLRENQFTKAPEADTFTEQLARTAQRALQGGIRHGPAGGVSGDRAVHAAQ